MCAFAATLELSSLDGTNGFKINGEASGDNGEYSGGSVSSAGDVNGDGFADLIVGAFLAEPNGFRSGKIGMSYGIRGDVPGFKDVGFDLGMTGLPTGPKGRFCRNGPNSFCLYTASKQQEPTWAYVNWVTQPEAQKMSFDLKRSVPARKSIANSGDFEKALYPWESAAVYRDASEKVRGFPLPSTYDDINKLFGTAYGNVLTGKQAVRDAIATVLPQMNQFLSQKL